jgi:tRNA(Ile)-lysidine synthase
MQAREKFIRFFKQHQISVNTRIAVAVSAGIDSMVLLHLLQQYCRGLVVVHIHHGKRAASEEEATFLKDYCLQDGIPFHLLRLHPEEEMSAGENFQEWARERRYSFLHEVAAKESCEYVATAHHLNDKAETFVMHALRGSGLNGLTSLRPISGTVIRPLLEATKNDIEIYARAHQLRWFEDESNAGDDYRRNLIRHRIIEEFSGIDPRWEKGLTRTLHNLEATQELLLHFTDQWKQAHVHQKEDTLFLSLESLSLVSQKETLLKSILHTIDAGLPVHQIAGCLTDAVGSKYPGKSHIALRDRNYLMIYPVQDKVHGFIEVAERTRSIKEPFSMSFSHLEFKNERENQDFLNEHITHNQGQSELFDASLLTFPLILRRWQEGDRFQPLGMKGFRKVSDYLTGKHLNRKDKENTWVLTSNGQIIWLIGHRMDDRFKVGAHTQKMYIARLLNTSRI